MRVGDITENVHFDQNVTSARCSGPSGTITDVRPKAKK